MLLDNVVEFCNNMYSSYGDKCGREKEGCNHPSGECSGSCYNCLYQVHFPKRPNEKTLYDCPKMLYHYVCQYSYLYTNELLCAFVYKLSLIEQYPYYHVLSLGCGGCSDLMALEILCGYNQFTIPIAYFGIDVNELWKPIHFYMKEYCKSNEISYKVCYDDIFNYFQCTPIIDANIIVISYLISYLCNTGQIQKVDILADTLAKKVIKNKGKQPLLLIINDVNSYYRGRDAFNYFINAIENNSLKVLKSEYKYFDNAKLKDGQKIGTPYAMKNVIFPIPPQIQNKYHAHSSINCTIQLLLEVL